MPSSRDSDRNLLFGILAVQLNFISRDDLVECMSSWVSQKEKPLAAILMNQGKLSARQAQELEARVAAYLHEHGDDAVEGLRAAAAGTTIASVLTPIDDNDIRASLANIQSSAQTRSYQSKPVEGTRYRKLQPDDPHGAGGQGVVYLAEDTELYRHVALKEMNPDFADDPDYRLKFVLEAEITAGLDHPGVVPVHGLGKYTDGRPYYAMRFLPGDNLEDAIKRFHAAETTTRDPGERNLAFRQLLRRFIDVCNTVAYAHSRGVLHRDIKPKNIMLGKFGETLVVDWGLAKMGVGEKFAASLADDPPLNPPSQAEFEATMQGAFKGTHGHSAPEQEQGRIDLLGPRSDVFSLGSTLCVLLTGKVPYDGVDRAELLKKYKKGEFTPPRETKPNTPRPLDAICRKAMAYEPKDRYQSALELAADVEHWLADERVSADREPWTARTRRWGRRHRTAVVGTMAFLVTAVIGLSVSTGLIWAEQRETHKQQIIAENNYRASREQLFNSIELIQSSDIAFASEPALQPRRKGILKSAAYACRDFLDHEPNDINIRKGAALVFRFKANVHRSSDEVDAAEPLYRDSLRLYSELKSEHPDDAAYREKLAETLRDAARLQANLGQLREARDSLNRSMQLVTELQQHEPERPSFLQIRASVLHELSFVDVSLGKDVAATKKSMDQAVETLTKLIELPQGKGHPYNHLLLAGAMNGQAVLEREAGEFKKADVIHRASLKLVKELLDKRVSRIAPADISSFQASCMVEHCRTSMAMSDRKEVRLAVNFNLGKAVDQWKALAATYPWVPYFRDRQAVAAQIRGELCLKDQRYEDAHAHLDVSRQLLEDLAKSQPRIVAYRSDLARTYVTLGQVARARDKMEDAARWFAQAAEAFDKAIDLSPDDVRLKKERAKIDK